MSSNKLTFGIYPGGDLGSDTGLILAKNPNNPVLIEEALNKLQYDNHPFLVRGYLHYVGFGETESYTPAQVEQYIHNGRQLDLVLCYQSKNGDVDDWQLFVRQQIRRYGQYLAKIQIAEEPNLYNVAAVDGDSPNVRQAVIRGVIAAKKEAKLQGFDIQVGFNGVPTFNPTNDFWRAIGEMGDETFLNSLDYVGLDFFPDVFFPQPAEVLKEAILAVLKHYRNVSLAEANIPATIPIHITENGWPTSPTRSYERQAEVLETNIRTIDEHCEEINITHYELFGLRDADSSNPDIFQQFGILKDDYSPKPAFETFRKLIKELSI